ncbi:MAG TPA: hypothetical protein ENI34_09530 [candidate division WOR-3 bacterium]|uniref:Uncharacterized protein n=1 Tax=candidate division WOR-3 bacterium TaxID=2052148 RepID=A0A9C9ENI9_UNCW3|nr:hypothetical protein [candidate division WOR-3 bacterium]
MKWYQAISSIDRRIIYLLLTLFIILPFFVPFKMHQNIMPQTQKLFDFVESIPPDEKAVMISFDYTPQTMPETQPMAIALLKHCFARGIPVIGVSFDPQGPGLAVDAFATVAEEFNAEAKTHRDSIIYGEDYVYLGWKSGFVAAILDMGESIAGVFPRDHFRNSIDSFPLMQHVKNYKEIAIAIILSGAAYPESWVLYAQSRYGVKIGAGLTAVMAPRYYPFLQTGQFSGMMSGMKGAAEYENLIVQHGYTDKLGRAETGMNSQSMIHILIIVLIILGNIGYIFSRRKR